MTTANWQPTASLEALQARAQLLADIRQFFAQREVLEVDTQVLSHGTITDVHLHPFATPFDFSETGKKETLYLQTSPEYAMKRLLCAYQTSIYQLGKAFRHEGSGRWHNPEFTLLEWYRIGFNHEQLMDEMDALLQCVLSTGQAERMSYQEAFKQHVGIDPLTASQAELADMLITFNIDISSDLPIDPDGIMQLLFSYVVEPNIGTNVPCFIHSFPASQAALARINQQDKRVADRFEVYFKGAELANGFYELANADEQRKRFEQDNRLRQTYRLEPAPVDERFLQALSSGLPECAGVAMGIDRLLMIKLGATHIQDVIPFPVSRA